MCNSSVFGILSMRLCSSPCLENCLLYVYPERILPLLSPALLCTIPLTYLLVSKGFSCFREIFFVRICRSEAGKDGADPWDETGREDLIRGA